MLVCCLQDSASWHGQRPTEGFVGLVTTEGLSQCSENANGTSGSHKIQQLCNVQKLPMAALCTFFMALLSDVQCIFKSSAEVICLTRWIYASSHFIFCSTLQLSTFKECMLRSEFGTHVVPLLSSRLTSNSWERTLTVPGKDKRKLQGIIRWKYILRAEMLCT